MALPRRDLHLDVMVTRPLHHGIAAENYQSELAWNLARALLEDEGLSEQACAVQQDAEAQELTGILRKLGTRHGSEAVRIAYRLHRNLGHPRKDTLVHICCRPRMLTRRSLLQLKPLSAHTATSFLHESNQLQLMQSVPWTSKSS